MKPKKPQPDELPATIPSATFENLAGLSSRRLRQLAEAGKFPQPKRDRWETVACLKGLLAHLRSGTDELRKARLAKLEAETRLLDQTHAEREGKLVDYDRALEVHLRGSQAIVATVMAMVHLRIEDREAIINQIREAGLMAMQLQAEVANENKSKS